MNQSISEEFEKDVEEAGDKWPVVIVAAAMAHAQTRPIEDAFYLDDIK